MSTSDTTPQSPYQTPLSPGPLQIQILTFSIPNAALTRSTSDKAPHSLHIKHNPHQVHFKHPLPSLRHSQSLNLFHSGHICVPPPPAPSPLAPVAIFPTSTVAVLQTPGECMWAVSVLRNFSAFWGSSQVEILVSFYNTDNRKATWASCACAVQRVVPWRLLEAFASIFTILLIATVFPEPLGLWLIQWLIHQLLAVTIKLPLGAESMSWFMSLLHYAEESNN